MTIAQLLTVTSILAILSSIAVPAGRDSLVTARGRASSANIRMIEAAKRQYAAEHPGDLPLTADIAYYLPGRQIPKGAHSGEVYLNACDLDNVTESSVNGDPACEPWSKAADPRSNELNDLGKHSRDVIPRIFIVTMEPLPVADAPY